MRKLILKLALTSAVALMATTAYSQTNYGPQWGENPEEQLKNVTTYNFFRDAYNNQDYNQAAGYLQQLLQQVPKAHQNIYINGINIYKDKILKATSVADKNMFIDSLMLLYDMRIANFGDDASKGRPYILMYKAQDYLNFKPSDEAGILKYFKEAVDANGDNVELDFLNQYFNELTNGYKADEVEAEDYMNEYERLKKIVDLPNNNDQAEAKNTFEALFISSGLATCENIEKLYTKKVEENPSDVDLLKRIAGMLTRQNCKSSEFFGNVAVRLYEIEPSSSTAIIIAEYYEAKKDYTKALSYLNAAMTNENDPAEKAKLGIRIASNELGSGNARNAASFARQVIETDPNNGTAYYILAQSYAVGANGCSGFNRQTVFWLVYDTLAKARNLLEADPNNPFKDIDSQMGSYRMSFPSKEECFFRGLNDGDPYQISCGWISGGTIVRQGR